MPSRGVHRNDHLLHPRLKHFAFAVSLVNTPDKYTASVAIVNLAQGGGSNYEVLYNRIDAALVVITIPIALIVIFAQKRIMSGLTAGALK